MHDGFPDIGGRRLERHVKREHILDESGHEFGAEQITEVTQTFDGTVETVEQGLRKVLACGHVHAPGQYLARCDNCSKAAGHPVYVCHLCATTCPVTGVSLCNRCSRLGPDGRRYSPEGFKRARKMGLFDRPSSVHASGSPIGAPRRNWLRKLLEWW